MTKARAALAAGAFAIGVLSSMLVLHAWPLWTGETIYLRVVPVDPRDLFRGDYVTLRYALNSLRRGDPGSAGQEPGASASVAFADGFWTRARASSQTVYVSLEPRPGAAGVAVEHVAVSVSDRKPERGPFLRGRARIFPWMRDAAGPNAGLDRVNAMTVDYGIDAFFIQEGRGREIEQAIRSGSPVYAEIAVTGSGKARVKALLVNGTRVEN